MLNYESLIEQARERGMPTDKIRGILREYLQVLILKEITRQEQGRRLYFTGGTYLRLIHHLRRFSEDLDFNSMGITKKEFDDLMKKISIELARSNINCDVKTQHWQNIMSAHLIFPDIENFYGAAARHTSKKGIVIKIETNTPRWKIKTETLMVSGFGEMYPVLCTGIGALFADKIDAIMKKDRARHLYDIIFLLSKGWLPDRGVLNILGITEEPMKVLMERVRKYTVLELKKLAEQIRPFLFDERDTDLILNAPRIVLQLLANYRRL